MFEHGVELAADDVPLGFEPAAPEEVTLIEERGISEPGAPGDEAIEPVEEPFAHEDREVDHAPPHGDRGYAAVGLVRSDHPQRPLQGT